jgi:hypothetical protein
MLPMATSQIAGSENLLALDQKIREAGEDPEQVALERIDADEINLGAAEIS